MVYCCYCCQWRRRWLRRRQTEATNSMQSNSCYVAMPDDGGDDDNKAITQYKSSLLLTTRMKSRAVLVSLLLLTTSCHEQLLGEPILKPCVGWAKGYEGEECRGATEKQQPQATLCLPHFCCWCWCLWLWSTTPRQLGDAGDFTSNTLASTKCPWLKVEEKR
jgi:hypothetical protein